ncbi:multicopper oxidase domain-containing protein, partial [Micromonospora sp. NPDC000207]|uniref:multicopper oxidase family protein n=1 Tax=Micromonospora sp. NPDC000207 TaxID=3154246 RepID=UPI00331B7FDA
MVTRRQVLLMGAAGGAAALVPVGWGAARDLTPRLDATAIPKYVTRLPVPGVMPALRTDGEADEYAVALRQFRQQVLPAPLPTTQVWGFGSAAHPGTFHYPARTVEARVDRPVRVTWLNELVDGDGRYLPHLLPVDPTVHWADPAGAGHAGTPSRYAGPVPMVVHLHGGHNREEADGYPDAWYLPTARDLPTAYARVGRSYAEFEARSVEAGGARWSPGAAQFEYGNDQRATALWYHDHCLGLTRLSVYAGAAGFYLLRGGDSDLPSGVLPGPADPGTDLGGGPYEIVLLIQDRSFRADGQLYYPDGLSGATGGVPRWQPSFFGDTIVVNGATWPVLSVQRRRYRFRLLNGCNSRFLRVSVVTDPAVRPARPVLPIWQVGSDGGFLPEPVELGAVPLSIGARVDVVVDFSEVPPGTELYLVNEGPDGSQAHGDNPVEADPHTTGQVLKFVVTERTGPDRSVPPDQLRLPAPPRLGAADRVRRLALLHARSGDHGGGGFQPLLGVVDERGRGVPLTWDEPVTEQVELGATEIWELHNFTGETHPVHLHQVQFEVVGRGRSRIRPPGPTERGLHDTVPVFPGTVTQIKARFDLPGRYAWHCHILEHEDNEMMRPYVVLPAGAVEAGGGGGDRP